MFRPRIIPVLLLRRGRLVKTRAFGAPVYLGDPLNAVRIFNELRADELVLLDIDASKERRSIPAEFVRRVGEEAEMPFAVGGGIRSVEQIRSILGEGAEKVILNTGSVLDPGLVAQASAAFGSSTVAVCLDVKRDVWGRLRTWSRGGSRSTGMTPDEHAQRAEGEGAGEIIVQSIARDGAMQGYDLALVQRISNIVTIPVVALGGAGSYEDLRQGFHQGHATGLAAGSLFVFQGPSRGVLIHYPDRKDVGL